MLKNLLITLFCLSLLAIAAAQTYNISHTQIYGSGLTTASAGNPSTFNLQLRDTNNNPVTSCGGNIFLITLTGPGTNKTLSSTCSSGRYLASYTNKAAGLYNLVVSAIATGQVIGSFTPTTNPGPIYPQNTIATGVTSEFEGIVGQVYKFTLTPYDSFNNRITSCPNKPSDWTVTLTGAVAGTGAVDSCNVTTGIYTAHFSAQTSGGYDMTVSINNGYIKGSPFHLDMNPGPLYPPLCEYLPYQGKTSVYAGEVTTFQVKSFDKFQNPISVCYNESTLTWNAYLSSSGKNITVNYVNCETGLYTLNYTVTQAATYSLNVLINGQSIESSPFSVQVLAARLISAAKTTASGVGLTNATAGFPSTVIIMPRDKYNNPNPRCDASWGDFDLELTGLNNASLSCSGQVVGCNQTNGYYTAQWTCYTSTEYTLAIEYQNLPIAGGPFIPFVRPGPLNGPTTTASGPGIIAAFAGEKSYVYLNPHDEFDNQITTCDLATFDPSKLTINVTANDESGINILGQFESCVPHPSGTVITVSYNITSIDLTILTIQYNNNPVYDSPFFLLTYPGPPAAGFCNATGPGLVSAEAGEYGVFYVTCTDRFENVISSCLPLDNWFYLLDAALLSNRSGIAWSCTNTTNLEDPAVTEFRYNQTQAGLYDLTFGYLNETLSPYTVTIFPGPFNSGNSIAIGEGVTSKNITAGDLTTFTIIARDQYGNELTDCIDQSKLTIVPTPHLQPYPNSTFQFLPCSTTNNITTVQYYSTLATQYSFKISYDGNPIQNNPYYPAVVAGPIDFSTIVASGSGLTQAVAGVPAPISLIAKDKYSNRVYYCNQDSINNFDLHLVKSDDNTVTVDGTVYGCTGGTYLGNYTATVSGKYNFSIQYTHSDIPGSPFPPVVVPGPNDFSKAFITSFNDNAVAGTTGYIWIVAKDHYNNNLTSCSPLLSFRADMTGIRSNRQFNRTFYSDQCIAQTGVYRIRYNVTQATSWTAVVGSTVTSVNVSNSPLAITVVHADVFPPNSAWKGFEANNTYVIGQQVGYSLTLYDLYLNSILDCSANASLFTVNTYLPDGTTYPATISCVGGTTWKGTFTALKTGDYYFNVQYNNGNFKGAPYYPLHFIYGYPSKLSFATGPGVNSTSYLVAGYQTWFQIHTTNQYNIPIESCPPAPFSASNWSVTFDQSFRTDSQVTSIKVNECNQADGTFWGYYTPTKARTYEITITLDGVNIQDDPYTPTVSPGAICPSQTTVGTVNATSDQGTIVVITKDCFGNYENSVNKSLFDVTLSPRCASAVVTTSSIGGTVYANYNLLEGGIYCPSILYDDQYLIPLNLTIHAIGGTACNNSCNRQGYCFKNQDYSITSANYTCNCFQGYTGEECSDKMSSKYPLAIGAVIGLIVGLAILMFIIGIILGFFVFRLINRNRDYNRV